MAESAAFGAEAARRPGTQEALPEGVASPEVLHEDDELRIRHIPGSGDAVVVAFTGIGHSLGSVQRDEFVGTASDGGRAHAVFVTDIRRSWYSRPGLEERILRVVGQLFDRLGPAGVHTLGNSMGGFGAILFAERLSAQSAIAFVPQFTMDRKVIDERRWSRFRPAMNEGNLASLDSHLTGACRPHAFFAADALPDRPHWMLLERSERAAVHLLNEGGHNIAHHLKTLGVLAPVIRAAQANDNAAVEDLIGPFSARPDRCASVRPEGKET